ncbi:hypothetical protein MHC_01370 [Mycoplasma haemocanis str. Illinois]|uniref:Lipoprotein n=1 Tax=Mycoplasma haemocanis (strain Illinois) TaxID=1111676 RepID=H6N668_MYCHN|nr:hypothetical protein [Mycoplasma haemocanis]AEW45140.1 hypothetical protein MHC_01370 [Mycoplasma haemocanis str. Illinois]
MVSAPVKIVCGLGVTGAVGVGCYFVAMNLSTSKKEKLLDRLSKEKFTLLSFENGNEAEWKKIVSEYEKHGTTNKLLGVNLVSTGNDKEQKNISAIKLACKSLVNGEDISEDSYVKARRWCVVPKKVKEVLISLNRKILKHEPSENQDDNIWTSKVGIYNHQTDNLPSITWNQSDNANKISELKKGCKALLDKDTLTYNEQFLSEYEKTYKICTSD